MFTDTLLNCFWGLFIIRIIQHLEWESLIISSHENTNWLWIIANKAFLTLILPSLLKTGGQYFNLIDCTTVHTICTTDYNQLTVSHSKIGSRLSYKLLLLLLSRFSHVWLCVTLWTVAHQAPLFLGFSRQEHWSGLPFPSPMHESEKWKWSRSVVSDS